MLELYYLKYGEIPEKERKMKNYLKALIVFILVFACAILCVSCGNNGAGDDTTDPDDGSVVQPPEGDKFEDDEESYRIRFVYSYTAKVVNDNGRTENKKEVVTVKSIYVPVDENELTAEHKTQIAGLTYHGFSFVKWYADWDTETQQPIGDEFNFDNAGKITKDIAAIFIFAFPPHLFMAFTILMLS